MPLVLASPLSLFVIGCALLLLWLATYYLLGKPLADAIRHVPVVGADLARAIMGALNTVKDWALDWAASAVSGVVEWFAVPIRAVYDFVSSVASAFAAAERAIGEVARVAAGEIGRVAGQLADHAARIATATAKAVAAASAANAAIILGRQLRDSTIPQAKQAAINTSAAYTASRIATEAGTRARAIDDVRLDLGRAIDGEASTRAARDAALAGAAAATAAQLGQRIRDAEAGARAHTDTRVRGVEDQLAQLRNVAIPAALATALAATNVVAQSLAQTQARCINPMCSTFGTQAGLWQSLMTGAELALVLSLVGQAVRDPEGTAGMVASGASALRSMGNGLLSPIIGVAA